MFAAAAAAVCIISRVFLGRLVAAFDCTYLQQMLQQHTCSGEEDVRVVGGAWTFDDPDNAFHDPRQDTVEDARTLKKATDMFLGLYFSIFSQKPCGRVKSDSRFCYVLFNSPVTAGSKRSQKKNM